MERNQPLTINVKEEAVIRKFEDGKLVETVHFPADEESFTVLPDGTVVTHGTD